MHSRSKIEDTVKCCAGPRLNLRNSASITVYASHGKDSPGNSTNNLSENVNSKKCSKQIISAIPRNRIDVLKWNGWGYRDSRFIVNDGIIEFTGNRYPIGGLSLPYFTQWAKDTIDFNFSEVDAAKPIPKSEDLPEPKISSEFLAALRQLNVPFSVDGVDRLVRGHGHTLKDIMILRKGNFERIPDVVAWPDCHNTVVKLVKLAHDHNVVIIPFGGGTNVTEAVCCPATERRTILSLDTSQMNRILWVDKGNLVACCECGIIGQDLERELHKLGFTTGHEPDSYEFSSLGGWVATRASGMKKNIYGNIEDLVVHVRMVTPTGVLEKNCLVPRLSCGPDFNHMILGSEGTLGVITDVVIKIRPVPPCKKYGSVVFPNFESGVHCLREVAKQKCQPASIRLMDNEQFKFGQSLRPVPGYLGLILDGMKRFYITKIKKFNVDQMCVATLLFEGDREDVLTKEKKIYDIAADHGGIPAGEKNGERGYILTFVIAYIRDLALTYNIVAESFETSVSWDRALSLCNNVKYRVLEECRAAGIKSAIITCRVTQTYDYGCCVYFYFGFKWKGLSNPLETYEHIEDKAREEILASGGSISHHHGVGKLRSKWYPSQVSEVGVELYKTTKEILDPKNIFANGNLMKCKS